MLNLFSHLLTTTSEIPSSLKVLYGFPSHVSRTRLRMGTVQTDVTSLASIPHCAIQLRAGKLMTSTAVAVLVVTGGERRGSLKRYRQDFVNSHLTMITPLFSTVHTLMSERLWCKLTPAFRTQNATCLNSFLHLIRKTNVNIAKITEKGSPASRLTKNPCYQKCSISILATKLSEPCIHSYLTIEFHPCNT